MPRHASLPPTFTVTIDRLVFGGEGLGYFTPPESAKKPRPIFVAGALPGETVRVAPVKVSSRFSKAKIVELVKASPDRRPPADGHHTACSPWQIWPEERQLAAKKELTLAMWQHATGDLPLPAEQLPIHASPALFGYRNKLEFAVAGEPGELQLAFHERGRWNRLLPAPAGCALAPAALNSAAAELLAAINRHGVPVAAVKNILARYSFASQQVLLAIFWATRDAPPLTFTRPDTAGVLSIFSDPARSQAVTTEILQQTGVAFLTEKMLGQQLRYGYESFFQVNPPAFEGLLREVQKWLPTGVRLADLYAGVGSIGCALAAGCAELRILESNPQAVEFARQNAAGLDLPVEIVSSPAEKHDLAQLLAGCEVVIVDPPRSGLHPAALAQLLAAAPPRLVYISCDPATQARDWQLLRQAYTCRAWQLHDFYPQTAHVESLLVLDRR